MTKKDTEKDFFLLYICIVFKVAWGIHNFYCIIIRSMKKTLLFLMLISMFGGSCAFAQRKQAKEEYVNSFFNDIPFNLHGTMTYGYVVSENGTHIKDGALAISCKLNKTLGNGYRRVNAVGNSTFNATYRKGMLNGAIKSTYNVRMKASNGESGTFTASISGGFLNGVPNGKFVINRKVVFKSSVTANYKNGVLVGAFSCSLLDSESSLPVKYSGTLTQNGKLTGTWNLNGETATFQNGVLVNLSCDGKSTKPAIAELSKKYAAGKITKEALANKNVYVMTAELDLNHYVFTAFIRDAGVDFGELGGYDFSVTPTVKYEYLEEHSMLTDKGAKVLLEQILNRIEGKKNGPEICNQYSYMAKYGHIYYDSLYKRHYMVIDRFDHENYYNSEYLTVRPQPHGRVHISPEHMAEIDRLADSLMFVMNVMPLKDVVGARLVSGVYDKSKKNAKSYLDGNENWSMAQLEDIKRILNDAYSEFDNDKIPHYTNADYVIWVCVPYYISMNNLMPCYIPVKSVQDYKLVLEKIDSQIQAIKEAEKEAKIRADKDGLME